MNKTKIILVDDHTLFRNGLKMLLATNDSIEVIGEASDGLEFLKLLDTLNPDIVFIDIEMPNLNGIEATRKALEKKPGINIVSLSMYGEEQYYYKMIESGARGFILKSSDITEVMRAIESVKQGGTYFSPDLLYNVVKNIDNVKKNNNQKIQLSERELEVLEHICKGSSNQQIAEVLFISKRTVEKHRASLLSKTNSKNTANLVMFAIENKLVEI